MTLVFLCFSQMPTISGAFFVTHAISKVLFCCIDISARCVEIIDFTTAKFFWAFSFDTWNGAPRIMKQCDTENFLSYNKCMYQISVVLITYVVNVCVSVATIQSQ